MKALIVGANGQLGQELRALFPQAQAVDFKELDISDSGAVQNYDWSKFEIILNAAAYTKVDESETPEGMVKAWMVNALGVANLASAARQHRLSLVHVSTDYVFDGLKQGEYSEDNPIKPQSNYGRSKAAGDLAATSAPNHYLIRTSWVIGKGPNFVRTMLKLGSERNEVSVVDDQQGRPTFASDLAASSK